MSGPELLIKGLSTGYPRRPVIRDLTLPPLPTGKLIAFVGPNAAGKSTLLMALAGLLPSTGTIALGDHELSALSARERAKVMAFTPQTLPQGVALTVIESVIVALRASATAEPHLPGGSAAHRAAVALDRLGISDLGLESLDQLSGGQRQLVSLAQALVREPRLLLLDEPTSALDLRHQIVVMDTLRRLAGEGHLVIVVLHDLNLAARWADYVVVFDHGGCAAAGTPAEALTAATIADVYGVVARIEPGEQGRPHIIIEGVSPAHRDAARVRNRSV
ncbi:ABC transporter ATP-binding protein [Rhodopseudomonas sp. WA056]|uniref:ABC transporter ATP-binding protein n=1 Tax=Rhodopseudomonas sp. WA056 TaxID=2269367 RepID=UPI0013E0B15C|nr:ABC transporter ATP-binding protein [Rhodopseudomonas sp. WA056]NEW87769.1 ABC transporter ATP-binding protein [Rhodopseudomonas sp. WA056]